jgi:hypothetical protein
MTSNSLVWFPMPADRHFSCATIFAENDKKLKKKKFLVFFYFFSLLRFMHFTKKEHNNVVIFWPNCALNFVRIYRAHPVHVLDFPSSGSKKVTASLI